MGFFKSLIRSFLSDHHPLLLLYHRIVAWCAAARYGFLSRSLTVLAVTGTNGKTTVVNLAAALLRGSGHATAFTSTVNFGIRDRIWINDSKMSTLGPFFLQRFLRQAVDAKCTHVVMEVTSHALVQSRICGVDLDAAVLTNVTGDHLEYHGGFEKYKIAKGLLFGFLMRSRKKTHNSVTPERISSMPMKISALNLDDEHFDYFASLPAEKRVNFGLDHGDVHARDIHYRPDGTHFTLVTHGGSIGVDMSLVGSYNIINVLAAVALLSGQKISLRSISSTLSSISPVPGRCEIINQSQPFSVVVDYAHNIDAVERLLRFYKEVTSGRLHVVFGATGGGRDKAKRPVIGKILDKYADEIVITSDDPYDEDEWVIATMVKEGIDREEGVGLWTILRREDAIRMAIMRAKSGDSVLILGKGAEPIQIIYGERRPWDDRQVARQILSDIGYV